MRPLSVLPRQVPVAVARPLSRGTAETVPVQQIEVAPVVPPSVVPRQLDAVARRLLALQRENADLRAELEQLRSA